MLSDAALDAPVAGFEALFQVRQARLHVRQAPLHALPPRRPVRPGQEDQRRSETTRQGKSAQPARSRMHRVCQRSEKVPRSAALCPPSPSRAVSLRLRTTWCTTPRWTSPQPRRPARSGRTGPAADARRRRCHVRACAHAAVAPPAHARKAATAAARQSTGASGRRARAHLEHFAHSLLCRLEKPLQRTLQAAAGHETGWSKACPRRPSPQRRDVTNGFFLRKDIQ